MISGIMAESSRLCAVVCSSVIPYLINKTLHFYKYDTHTYFNPCSSTYIDRGNTLKLKALLPYILHDTKRYWGKSDFTYSHNRHVKTHGMQDTEGGVKSTIKLHTTT